MTRQWRPQPGTGPLGLRPARLVRVAAAAVSLILAHGLLMASLDPTVKALGHAPAGQAHAVAVDPGKSAPGDHPAGCEPLHEAAPRQDHDGGTGSLASSVNPSLPEADTERGAVTVAPRQQQWSPARADLQVWRI